MSYGFIYKIENKINHKIYIGQTTRTVLSRWKEHISQAKDINKPHHYFHNAINKYGEENFIVKEIDSCDNKEELNAKEIYYISIYNSNNPKYGYNLTKGGEGGYTSEVCQLDLNGKLLKTYPSIAQASRETGCSHSSICGCCTGTYNQSLSYQWCYKKDLKERINQPAIKKKQTNIPVIQLTKNGDFVKLWYTIKEAQDYYNISNGKISAVCRGKRITTAGYKWKYLFPQQQEKTTAHYFSRPVNQFSKDGRFIKKFNSVNEASLSIGQQKGGHISEVCKGKRAFCGGYKWEYADEEKSE